MSGLRVLHYPEMNGPSFAIHVDDEKEAIKVMDLLYNYDVFQSENKLAEDVSTMSVLQMHENGKWVDWKDYDSGINDVRKYYEHREDN